MPRRYGVANPSGNTAGQGRFASIPRAEIPRSVFNRSCGRKSTFDAGYLVPIFVDEALPGDTMTLRCNGFGRLATPIFPLMDNLYMDFFFFAVPNRLVWANWNKFNGEQANPGDTTDYEVPQMTSAIHAVGSLADYFGLPAEAGLGITFNSLHHRAYNLIWNEWFRDENLQDSVVVDTDDGPDDPTDYVILKRGKRHDYFTSALPFPQKGDPVLLPLGSSAPLIGAPDIASLTVTGSGAPTFLAGGVTIEGSGTGSILQGSGAVGSGADLTWNNPNLDVGGGATLLSAVTADLSAATAATINQIREAFQVQRLLERDARGGSRYTEIIRSHFGVISPDARLQRPEYLGGGSTRINVHPVARTVGTSSGAGVAPVAELGGFGTWSQGGVGFNKSFTEHCVIIGLVNVRADLNYQQGMPRMFSRRTRFDFFWPALAHLGEQAILNKEIYYQADPSAANEEVFGYQERYAEYRYKPSEITGQFRSTFSTPLDQWHLGLEFSALPELNDVFIEDDPPIARVIAVPTKPHMLADFWFDFKHARPMPTFSVPGMIDHF